jgi:hypothetical protein
VQRDIDLIRHILLDLEARGSYTDWLDVDIEEYSPEQVDYHLELLIEAGLIRVPASGMELSRRHPLRLTWEGHEFLDAARSEMRWQKVKASADKIDGLLFAFIKAALLEMARQETVEYLPLPE